MLDLKRFFLISVLCVALSGLAAAHEIDVATPDLSPDKIESRLEELEMTAAEPPETGWGISDDEPSSFSLALRLMARTGTRPGDLRETERILNCYDALRRGIVDGDGRFVGEIFVGYELLDGLSALDVRAVAPHVPRLDAWRAEILEASGGRQ